MTLGSGILIGLLLVFIAQALIFKFSPQIRKAIITRVEPEAYKSQPVVAEDSSLVVKAAVYEQISSLSRARAVRLLNDIVRELVGGDPKISTARVQMLVPDLAKIAEKLSTSEFMFLLSSAIDRSAYHQLLAADQTES